MDIQEIFNKVIDGGYYNKNCGFMCASLSNALQDNVIHIDEFNEATNCINDYLIQESETTLKGLLCRKGIDYSFKSCLVIYKDWKNRPFK